MTGRDGPEEIAFALFGSLSLWLKISRMVQAKTNVCWDSWVVKGGSRGGCWGDISVTKGSLVLVGSATRLRSANI